MQLVFASTNQHKKKEFAEILADCDIELLSLDDLNIHVEIEENGKSFAENAYIKAKTIYDLCHLPTIADDSGLTIEALPGILGIHSARFRPELGYREKCEEILSLMKNVHNRSAYFTCNICIVGLHDKPLHFEGIFSGEIALERDGENGFGYDPIFYVPEMKMTSARMSEEMKNKISHRGLALQQLKEYFMHHKERM